MQFLLTRKRTSAKGRHRDVVIVTCIKLLNHRTSAHSDAHPSKEARGPLNSSPLDVKVKKKIET